MFQDFFGDHLALVSTVPSHGKWAFTWLEAKGHFGARTKDLLWVAVLGRRISDQAWACSYCKRLTHPDIGTFSPPFCPPAGWSIVKVGAGIASCDLVQTRRRHVEPQTLRRHLQIESPTAECHGRAGFASPPRPVLLVLAMDLLTGTAGSAARELQQHGRAPERQGIWDSAAFPLRLP